MPSERYLLISFFRTKSQMGPTKNRGSSVGGMLDERRLKSTGGGCTMGVLGKWVMGAEGSNFLD